MRKIISKIIFTKNISSDWFEEVFVINKVRKLCRGHMLLAILAMNKLIGGFKKKKKNIKNNLELKR